MDHDQTLDALDLAAAEPGGLDRLMAGDTPQAMAVAAHLAGCASCTLELERVRRSSAVIRDVVASTPPPELRARTLAYVRTHGVPRGVVAATGIAPGPPAAVDPPMPPPTILASVPSRDRRRGVLGWMAAVAAAVALSVVATSFIVGGRVDDRLTAQDQEIEHLADVTTATLHLAATPDVASVTLASPSGSAVEGTLLFSPETTQVVVVATGLTEPAAGMEYRCWVQSGPGGTRQGIGRMFFGGGLAYWVGPSSAVAGLTSDARFGVSLVAADGSVVGNDPVLRSGS